MFDLSDKCIFSGSSDNLNTIITISIDNEQYKVAISDEYSNSSLDDIRKQTQLKIKPLLEMKKLLETNIEEFRKLANNLGYDIIKLSTSNVTRIVSNNAENETNTQTMHYKSSENNQRKTNTRQRSDSKADSTQKSEVYSSKTVKTFAGYNTNIPNHIKDSYGDTIISIDTNSGAKSFEKRCKQLQYSNVQQEYNNSCSVCTGSGVIISNGTSTTCNACNGVGVLF